MLFAFEQDQLVKRTRPSTIGGYAASANPVGHLVLPLFECFGPERADGRLNLHRAALTNFWQDVARDFAIAGVHPEEDMRRFGYREADRKPAGSRRPSPTSCGSRSSGARLVLPAGCGCWTGLPPAVRLD